MVNVKTKAKLLTHEQMISKMLERPEVKAALEDIDQTEFAILDELLAANKSVVLTQSQCPINEDLSKNLSSEIKFR